MLVVVCMIFSAENIFRTDNVGFFWLLKLLVIVTTDDLSCALVWVVGINPCTCKPTPWNYGRFQVLTAASMMFRAVFWVVLPCKKIVDRRFRGTCCLHHQGGRSRATEGSRFSRSRVTRWSVVVGDDWLGTGQWEWAGGRKRREREV
jgi:hypothetical protein